MPFLRVKNEKSKKEIEKNGPRALFFENEEDSYTGEWKNELKHGFGTQVWGRKKLIYTGSWKNGKRNGKGTLYSTEDKGTFIYNGLWKNDKRNGQGIQNFPEGGSYKGHWKKDKRHGFGRMEYNDKSHYIGNWRKDQRSGKGVMTYADGSIYTGNWHQDMRSGKGILLTKTKDKYEGTWQNDMKHGEGSFIDNSIGTKMCGVWQRNIPRCGQLEVVQSPDPPTRPQLEIPKYTLANPQEVINISKKHYLEKCKEDIWDK